MTTQTPANTKILPVHSNATYVAELEAQITALEIHRRERTRKSVGCALVWGVAMVLGYASGGQAMGERGYAAFTLFVYLL